MHGTKLYVGNLSYSATSQEVEELFAKHGTVVSVKIIERKGFGFVEMSTQAEAEEAKEKLDGTEFMQRRLKVNEAKPQTDQKRRPFHR
jgi:RNA recognition motif-containing protein